MQGEVGLRHQDGRCQRSKDETHVFSMQAAFQTRGEEPLSPFFLVFCDLSHHRLLSSLGESCVKISTALGLFPRILSSWHKAPGM